MSVIDWLESIFGSRERPVRRKVFINKPVDWSNTWMLSDSVRQIGFLTDGQGNIMAIPTIAIDTSGASPVPARNPRPAYYDRSGLTVGEEFDNPAVPPHAFTLRWIYTVPVNRKFCIQQVSLYGNNAVAGGTLDVEIWIFPLGGGVGQIIELHLHTQEDYLVAFPQLIINAGDSVNGGSASGGTAGNVNIKINMTGLEFDA